MKELKLIKDPRVALVDNDITSMAQQDTDAMLWFADRWWWFPGSRIGAESEFEWRDKRVSRTGQIVALLCATAQQISASIASSSPRHGI